MQISIAILIFLLFLDQISGGGANCLREGHLKFQLALT